MAKKKQHKQQPQLDPFAYIRTKARTLPIYKCYINSNWKEKGLASIIVARQHTTGNFTTGMYIVDTFCKGLVQTYTKFNGDEDILKFNLELHIPPEGDFITLMEIDYTLAHNIIYGAISFAEENGYKPHKDFETFKYILEEDDEDIELIEIDFGVDGKPFLIERDYEDAYKE